MKRLLFLVVSVIVIAVTGCQTRDVEWRKVYKDKDGKDVIETFKDKTHGVPNWSDGAGKIMPFANWKISGFSAGK